MTFLPLEKHVVRPPHLHDLCECHRKERIQENNGETLKCLISPLLVTLSPGKSQAPCSWDDLGTGVESQL